MRDKMLKKILPLLLSVFIATGSMPGMTARAYDSEQVYDIALPGIYHQSEARNMLPKINALRKNQAWAYSKTDLSAWSEDCRIDYNNLPQVQYDYKLEQYAMKRAAEIALVYDHKRPGSTGWSNDSTDELMSDCPELGVSSENLYLGLGVSADAAFKAWLEEDCTYEGQGHRRNMLGIGSNMNPNGTVAVGIACFSYNGCNYWVQIFADKVLDSVVKPANNAETTVDLKLADHKISALKISTLSGGNLGYERNSTTDQIISDTAEIETIEVAPGDTLPELCELLVSTMFCASGDYYSLRFPLRNKINIENNNVITIKNGKLQAVGLGKTKISSISQITGKEITAYVNVRGIDLGSWGSCEIDENSVMQYTGESLRPKVIVKQWKNLSKDTDDFVVLTEGEDYKLCYENNTNSGRATVTVTGVGKYSGTLTTYFDIVKTRLGVYCSCEINGDKTLKYTGKAIKPKVTVKYKRELSSGIKDTVILTEGKDYELSYLNNISPGIATIVITGIGQYSGTLSDYFEIVKESNVKKNRLAKGKTFKKGGITYKVLTSTNKEGTVAVFKSATRTKSVKIPSSVKDENGFSYNVTTISKSAFKGNKTLTSVTLNAGICKVESNAFASCKKLKLLTIPGPDIKIGKNAFKGIASRAKITIKTGDKSGKKSVVKNINKTGGAKNAVLK